MLTSILTLALVAASCTSTPMGEISTPEPVPVPGVNKEFKLNNALQSHMVIQQGKPFTVWGEGDSDDIITVKPSWSETTFSGTVDKDGFWSVTVDVPAALPDNVPQKIVIANGNRETYTLNDVLIGEVWFLSGQSNMEMTMKPALPWHEGVENWESEIAAADVPLLRFFTSERIQADEPQWNGKGGWYVCNPGSAGDLSGVGYYFARKLIEKMNVPVGLVITSHGGMSAQMFTSEETLASDEVLNAKYLRPYLNNPSSVDEYSRPAKLYNGMVYPFFPLSVRGILWYQGENNAGDRDTYDILETAKLADWRTRFGQGDLPYYFVQLTPFCWGSDPSTDANAFYNDDMGKFRDTQARIRQNNENCEMVVSLDTASPLDIHPRNKKDIGERLARIALNRDYGFTDINYLGPSYESHREENGIIKIKFTNSLNGLDTKDGNVPKHFMVAGADRKYHHAESAVIKGDEVWLTCPAVTSKGEAHYEVRYAYLTGSDTNLQNSDGLPAEQFRTDSWPQVTYERAF